MYTAKKNTHQRYKIDVWRKKPQAKPQQKKFRPITASNMPRKPQSLYKFQSLPAPFCNVYTEILVWLKFLRLFCSKLFILFFRCCCCFFILLRFVCECVCVCLSLLFFIFSSKLTAQLLSCCPKVVYMKKK